MKTFTLSLLSAMTAMAAVTVQAQTTGTHGETLDAHGIIIAPPADAELRSYDREGLFVAYSEQDQNLYANEINDRVEIAVCTDGTYFVKDPVSQVKTGAWVCGKRSGNELRIPAAQPLDYDESDGTTLQTFHCLLTPMGDIEDGYADFVYKITPLSNGAEALALQPYATDTYAYSMMGALWTDAMFTIEAIGDYDVILTYDPSNVDGEYDAPVVLPDGISLRAYTMHAYSYLYTAENGYRPTYIDAPLQIGSVGDDVYVRGLYYFLPELVVKGHREGNVVRFPQHQFLGKDDRGVDIFALAVKYGVDEDGVEVFVDGASWTLTYDAANDFYFGDEDGGVRFARNRYYRYGNSYETLDEILIYPDESGNSLEAIQQQPARSARTFGLDGRKAMERKGLIISDGKVMLCK